MVSQQTSKPANPAVGGASQPAPPAAGQADQRGLTLTRLLVWVLVVGGVLAVIFLLLTREQARARDAKRVADMTRLAAAFELLYAERASYEAAAEDGCKEVGSPANTCSLALYFPGIGNLTDPSGGAYLLAQVPTKDSYAVSFSLERGYSEVGKGPHLLTPEGIK